MQYLCKTTTGEGSAPVHILYTPTEDGVEIDSLLSPGGFDLSGYFYDDEIKKFKEDCQAHFDLICLDSKADAAISRWESKSDWRMPA